MKTELQPYKSGEPTVATSIVAVMLSEMFLSRKDIIKRVYPDRKGFTQGFLSNIFKILQTEGILEYKKERKVWIKGPNYYAYVGFIVSSSSEDLIENFQYLLLPKSDENSMDFILSPSEQLL